MIRSAVKSVVWVGRATVFFVGLVVILALLLGVASTALAHAGSAGLFHLGHNNPVSATSTLTGNLALKVLQVTNTGTASGSAAIQANNASVSSPAVRAVNSGGGPALELRVGSTGVPANDVAPMRVNSNEVVTNLNADKLDGKDESEFLGKTETAANSDKLDGKDFSELGVAGYQRIEQRFTLFANTGFQQFDLECPNGKRPLGGGFATEADNANIKVKSSSPQPNLTTWTVTASNSGTTDTFIDVTAICGVAQQ